MGAEELTVLDRGPSTAVVVSPSVDDTTIPQWALPLIAKVDALRLLRQGWDSRNAEPITSHAAATALNVMAAAMNPQAPMPVIAPNPDGGIVLEWIAPTFEIIVDVHPNGTADSSMSVQGDDGELSPIWDGPWSGCHQAVRDVLYRAARHLEVHS